MKSTISKLSIDLNRAALTMMAIEGGASIPMVRIPAKFDGDSVLFLVEPASAKELFDLPVDQNIAMMDGVPDHVMMPSHFSKFGVASQKATAIRKVLDSVKKDTFAKEQYLANTVVLFVKQECATKMNFAGAISMPAQMLFILAKGPRAREITDDFKGQHISYRQLDDLFGELTEAAKAKIGGQTQMLPHKRHPTTAEMGARAPEHVE
jgi:hypothetical protein